MAALDTEVRRDLRGLQKDTADSVARHLVAAGSLVDEDPQLALEHARYARRRASRIAVVREAAGIAAYHAGEWAEALAELRAARRMGGGPIHLPVMADIERALGRPERAVDIARGTEAAELGTAGRIELAIVGAGARRDLGELDAAVVGLQIPELDPSRREPWSVRLFYAYADNLLAAGRESDALQWFVHAADADTDGETDAVGRIAELTGEDPDDADDFAFGVEDVAPEAAGRVADTGDGPEAEDVVAGEDQPDDRSDEAGPDASVLVDAAAMTAIVEDTADAEVTGELASVEGPDAIPSDEGTPAEDESDGDPTDLSALGDAATSEATESGADVDPASEAAPDEPGVADALDEDGSDEVVLDEAAPVVAPPVVGEVSVEDLVVEDLVVEDMAAGVAPESGPAESGAAESGADEGSPDGVSRVEAAAADDAGVDDAGVDDDGPAGTEVDEPAIDRSATAGNGTAR